MVERTSVDKGNQLVASHEMKYNLDGDRSEDVETLDRASSSATLDQTSTFAYTPAQKLKTVTRTGASKGANESYVYDAAGNITSQTIGSTTTTMTYDKNRLTTSSTGSTTFKHRYDSLGRATTVGASTVGLEDQVVERYAYDGYDRMVRKQEWNSLGVHQATKTSTFDPFDRTTTEAVKVLAQTTPTTKRFTYLGMADQVSVEEQKNTAGDFEVSKVFSYGPGGEKLALIDSPVNETTSPKTHYYGTNPHGDVETLTDENTGQTTSTYRYTAYGSADKVGTTGADEIKNDPVQDADMVNPYRFGGKRYEGATGSYDMGFRDYDPGLNRFTSRDMYNGALDDMAMGTDPWNSNRYAFAGGNPISKVDLDGHYVPCDGSSCPTSYSYPEDPERQYSAGNRWQPENSNYMAAAHHKSGYVVRAAQEEANNKTWMRAHDEADMKRIRTEQAQADWERKLDEWQELENLRFDEEGTGTDPATGFASWRPYLDALDDARDGHWSRARRKAFGELPKDATLGAVIEASKKKGGFGGRIASMFGKVLPPVSAYATLSDYANYHPRSVRANPSIALEEGWVSDPATAVQLIVGSVFGYP
jgi:RHS repeat-associated protein